MPNRNLRQNPARVGPDALLLGRTAKTTDNKAETMAAQLQRWLQRYARAEARRQRAILEQSAVVSRVFRKADPPSRRELEAELWKILIRSGVPAFRASTRRAIGDDKAVITDLAMASFMRTKRIRLQQIMASTQRAVEESVRQIILTALEEEPRPSTNELGRRIARVYHGDAGGRAAFVGDTEEFAAPGVRAPLINPRVLPTRRVSVDDGGNLYQFSFERAQLIARTEMAQAENEGIVEGYKQTGVQGLRWLAYRDGRSGKREHDKMHRKTVRLGQSFLMPDKRTRMRYPGDPSAPIRHLANCRCTVAPVMIM